MSNVSISGAISGIDTASLVNQLMSVEAQSQNTIKTRQTAAQKAADTYTTLIASLKSLATQSATLAKTSDWQGSSVTSTASSVTATTTGNAVGTITFDVTEVAAAHTQISVGDVPTTSSVVAGGPLTVTSADGSTTKGTIDVGSGTLAEVVAGINASPYGLRAAAVQIEPGKFRLQVTSTTSGTAAAFALDGLDAMGGTNVLTAGRDALLTIGKDSTYTVTSATNTFSDLLPGVSFTVSKKGETDVTVDAKIDGSAVATQIKSMVDATNAALASLTASTAYDFTTRTGAPLYGDNGIRGLQQQILSTVGAANAPGVQLTRDGTLTFDNDAFIKAFQADPTGTAAAYGVTSSFTPNTGVLGKAAMVLSNSSTQTGTFAIGVSSNAAADAWSASSASMAGKTVVLTKGALIASYAVGALESPASAATNINAAAAAAGIKAVATVSGGSIIFTAGSVGTASAFSVSVGGSAASHDVTAQDVQGTIDGQPATGAGNLLLLSGSSSRANGLGLQIDVSDADIATAAASFGGIIGQASFAKGLAGGLSKLLSDATDSSTGALSQAQQSRVDDVKDFQAQIDAWDVRLTARRATLTRQFTAMETALASLKSSSSAITNLLASPSGSNSAS